MKQSYDMVLFGGSSGSLEVLLKILPFVRKSVTFSIVIVLHRKNSSDATLSELLAIKSALPVKEIEDKDIVLPGHVYLVPADYHLLFEKNKIFSLDDSEKVNFSRPSIDVTFESAAYVYGDRLVAMLLSGSNNDGTLGLRQVAEQGGLSIVQHPDTASSPYMPQQAILHAPVHHQYTAEEMLAFMNS